MPIANSPSTDAPSSTASISRSRPSPEPASDLTTRPSSNRSRTSSTSRPPKIAGYENRTSPRVTDSSGPVNTSPSGKLRSPSAGIHVRPATPTVMSVSSATTRSSRTPSSLSVTWCSLAENSFQALTGSARCSHPERNTKSSYCDSDMPASCANASHGYAVTHQVRSPLGRALHVALHHRAVRLLAQPQLRRVDPRQLAGVVRGVHGDPGVDHVHLLQGERRKVRQLLLARLRQERVLDAGRDDPRPGMRADGQDLLDQLGHQRLGQRRRLDQHELARLQVERVADHDLGQPLDAGIGHRNFPSWTAARRRRTPRRRCAGRGPCPSAAWTGWCRRPAGTPAPGRRGRCRRSSRRTRCCRWRSGSRRSARTRPRPASAIPRPDRASRAGSRRPDRPPRGRPPRPRTTAVRRPPRGPP